MVESGARQPVARGLGPWLAQIAPRSARGTVTVAIVSDGRIRQLNQRYRGIGKPTDVLSFPSRAAPPPSHDRHLGDIVIARGIAQKQAKKLGHGLATELRVLALHGLLHLLGYDHEIDDGRMARVEARLRRKARLPMGLIGRSAPRA